MALMFDAEDGARPRRDRGRVRHQVARRHVMISRRIRPRVIGRPPSSSHFVIHRVRPSSSPPHSEDGSYPKAGHSPASTRTPCRYRRPHLEVAWERFLFCRSSARHTNGGTIGFVMKDAAQAEAWHKAGVANGGTSIEDPPGKRPNGAYLAYLRDPDGHKLVGVAR